MACFSGKEEIESITERVSEMKNDKENVDRLLEHNVADQLEYFDWNGLNAAISGRIDKAQPRKTYAKKYPIAFKIAAGLTVAAAVILITMMSITERPANVGIANIKGAVVSFIDKKGLTSIEIKQGGINSQTTVDVGNNRHSLAKCTVEIINLNGSQKGDCSAWIIISRPEPMLADNRTSSYENDLIYLF